LHAASLHPRVAARIEERLGYVRGELERRTELLAEARARFYAVPRKRGAVRGG
jgi:hypothetical protein